MIGKEINVLLDQIDQAITQLRKAFQNTTDIDNKMLLQRQINQLTSLKAEIYSEILGRLVANLGQDAGELEALTEEIEETDISLDKTAAVLNKISQAIGILIKVISHV